MPTGGHGGRRSDVQAYEAERLQIILGPLQREDRSAAVAQVASRGGIAVGIDRPASRLHVGSRPRDGVGSGRKPQTGGWASVTPGALGLLQYQRPQITPGDSI